MLEADDSFDFIFDDDFENGICDNLDNISLMSFTGDDDSFDDTTTSASDTSQSTTKRRRPDDTIRTNKTMKSHITTIPRSVPTDIRHTYTTIFTNMFNAFQYPLWTNYFTTYCTSDVLFVESSPKSMRPNFPRYIEIIGARLSSQFMFNRMQIIPDAVFSIKKTKLFTRSDTSESLVVSSFTIKGTKLYDVNLEPLLPPALHLREGVVKQEGVIKQEEGFQTEATQHGFGYPQPTTSEYIDVNSGNIYDMRKNISSHFAEDIHPNDVTAADQALITSYSDYIDRCPILDRPLEVTVTGTLTMHLDVNKRIRKFELNTANKVLQGKHIGIDMGM